MVCIKSRIPKLNAPRLLLCRTDSSTSSSSWILSSCGFPEDSETASRLRVRTYRRLTLRITQGYQTACQPGRNSAPNADYARVPAGRASHAGATISTGSVLGRARKTLLCWDLRLSRRLRPDMPGPPPSERTACSTCAASDHAPVLGTRSATPARRRQRSIAGSRRTRDRRYTASLFLFELNRWSPLGREDACVVTAGVAASAAARQIAPNAARAPAIPRPPPLAKAHGRQAASRGRSGSRRDRRSAGQGARGRRIA